MARARRRRGPDLAGLADRPPPGGPARPPRPRARLPLHRHGRGRQGLQGPSTAPTAASEARTRGRGPSACASPTRARPSSTTSSAATRPSSTRHLDDPVIARADGSVLYNFAVAIDDLDAGITHVIRGEDHLSNTPKQLLVLEALGAEPAAATPTSRSCTAPTARSSPSATARRRSRSCATPATSPRRSATTSRCWAGATPTTRPCSRPTQLVERFAIDRVSRNPAALRRAEAALDERPLPARAVRRTS